MKKVYLNTLTPEEIIKRLKNGEVVKKPNGDLWKLVDGIIVKYYHNLRPAVGAEIDIVDSTIYFEEEEPFEITETGVYKIRDGRKAFVYEISDDTDDIYPVSYILENVGNSISVTKQGREITNQESILDIVAKWED